MTTTALAGQLGSRTARIAGGLYLAYVLATVAADVVGHIGMGSPSQVYGVITSSLVTFQLAYVLALGSGLLFLLAAWALYRLLRGVDGDVALLFLLLNAVGVAVQTASLLALIPATRPGEAAAHIGAYSPDQLEGMAYLAITSYKASFVTAQLFFGTWLFPLGYLVYRSGLVPRALGVLLVLDGVAVLIWFLQAFLLPDLKVITYPGLAVSFVAEVGLGLWLLVRGVRVEREPTPTATRPRTCRSSRSCRP